MAECQGRALASLARARRPWMAGGPGSASMPWWPEATGAYQCTPFMRLAIAICSIEAFSLSSVLPFAAAESGKTL
jgi:hypothetical protein